MILCDSHTIAYVNKSTTNHLGIKYIVIIFYLMWDVIDGNIIKLNKHTDKNQLDMMENIMRK